MAIMMAKEDKKWQGEDDARTMMRAGEIMADKKRHAACMKEMQKQKMSMDGMMAMMSGEDKIEHGLRKYREG